MAFKSFFLLAVMATTSTAHMVLKEPKPFPTNNSPLEEDGSNYPCKVTSYATDSRTEYPLGSTQTMRFTGSAVHGGGSCQVAITYDKNPTKQSEFKVIHSIEGGCPAKNMAGNLPANPSGDAPDGYDFKIPTDLPTGDAILAWTWFNRIGNREMYMNCAPIKITGTGGGDMGAFSKLPDIMIANIGAKMCKVGEGADVKFPNPGKSISSFPFNGQLQDLSSQPACAYNWMAGGPKSAAIAASATEKPNADKVVVAADKASTLGEAPVPAKSSAAAAPTASAAVAASALNVAPASSSSNGGSCTASTFMCMGTGYMQCLNGVWSAEMPLAPGTKCAPGVSASLNVMAARSFRA